MICFVIFVSRKEKQMRYAVIQILLIFSLINFTSGNVHAIEFDELYDLIRTNVRNEARLSWTSIFYAGSKNVSEARAQCKVDPEVSEYADHGWGLECVIGFNFNLQDKFDSAPQDEFDPNQLGAPLTSCASQEAHAASIFGGQKAHQIFFEGQGTDIEIIKFNSFELVSILIEVEDALHFYQIEQALWRSDLDKIETELRNKVNLDPYEFKIKVLSELNKFSKSINSQTGDDTKVATSMACGGGIFLFSVTVLPNSGNVELIPKMFFNYCIDKGIDINDKNSCRHFLTDIRVRLETNFIFSMPCYPPCHQLDVGDE